MLLAFYLNNRHRLRPASVSIKYIHIHSAAWLNYLGYDVYYVEFIFNVSFCFKSFKFLLYFLLTQITGKYTVELGGFIDNELY